jgi:hypothetical protein
MNETTTMETKKLICPDCDEECELQLSEVTAHITVMRAKDGKWDDVNPVQEEDDDVNPNQAIICSKCGYEFATSQEPLMTSDEFDELEEKILKGTVTQEDLE